MKCRLIAILLMLVLYFPSPGYAKLNHISLKLAWVLNDQYAGEVYAYHKGWYKDSGINLEFKPYKYGTKDPYHSVVSGEADIGESEPLVVIREALRDNENIVIFGLKDQISPAGLLSLKKKNIMKPSNIEGYIFGYYNDGDKEILKWYCELNGVDYNKIQKRRLLPNDMQPLISETIDFIIAHETNEPVILKLMGYDSNFLSISGPNGVHFGSAYFCTEDFYNANKKDLIRFMKTSSKGWKHVIMNPLEGSNIVIKYYPKNRLINNSREFTLKKFEKGINIKGYYLTHKVGIDCIGCMSKAYWDIVLNELLSAKIIKFTELASKLIRYDVSKSLLIK